MTPIPEIWKRAAAALIATVEDAQLRADLREQFEHRAAVAEFDGGLSRIEAERHAFREVRTTVELIRTSRHCPT